MRPLLDSPAFVDCCERALAVLADSAAKGVVLLALAWLIALGLRRGSAAARHLVWMLALIGLLLLPVLSLVLPRWQLPILPRTSLRAKPASNLTDQPPPPTWQVVPLAGPGTATADPGRTFQPTERSTFTATLPESPARPLPWSFLLLAAWLVVAMAALVPLCFGILFVGRLIRRAEPLEHDPWPELLRTFSVRLGLCRDVQLLRTSSATMPMAVGVWRPTVLLPAAAEAWSTEQRQAVLLHELAHIRRWDCLTHILTRLACIAHWFNPLAWWALKTLQHERERACDDLVLAAGARPAAYAGQLLAIARTMRAGAAASTAAIPLARKSQLEGRLRAILDTACNRHSLKLKNIVAGFAVALFLILPLAMAQLSGHPDAKAKNAGPLFNHYVLAHAQTKTQNPDGSTALHGAVRIEARLAQSKLVIIADDAQFTNADREKGQLRLGRDAADETMEKLAALALDELSKGATDTVWVTADVVRIEKWQDSPEERVILEGDVALITALRSQEGLSMEVNGRWAGLEPREGHLQVAWMSGTMQTVQLGGKYGKNWLAELRRIRAAAKVPPPLRPVVTPPGNPAEERAKVSVADRQAASTLVDKARHYPQQDQFRELEQMLKQALEKDPTNADAWALLGNIADAQYVKRHDEAWDAYMKSLKYDPDNLEALTHIAYIYFTDKRPDEAQEYFNKVLQRDPQYRPALYGLIQLLIDREDFAGAAPYLDRMVKLAPDDPGTRYLVDWYEKEKSYRDGRRAPVNKPEESKLTPLDPAHPGSGDQVHKARAAEQPTTATTPATSPLDNTDQNTTAALTGTVVSAGDGRPLAGVRVQAIISPDAVVRRPVRSRDAAGGDNARTGPDGRFSLVVPAPPDATGAPPRAGLFIQTPGFRSPHPMMYAHRLRPGQTTDVGQVRLTPALYVAGIVRDEQGQPLPDTQIEAWQYGRYDTMKVAEASTDGNGRFEIFDFPDPDRQGSPANPATRLPFMGSLIFNRFDRLRTKVDGIYDRTPEQRKNLTVTLQAGGTVRGRVLDAAGRPATGVLIDAMTPDLIDRKVTRTATGNGAEGLPAGGFVLAGLPTTATLTLRAHDIAGWQKVVRNLKTDEVQGEILLQMTSINLPVKPTPVKLFGMQLVGLNAGLIDAFDLKYSPGHNFDHGVLILDPGPGRDRFGSGPLEPGFVIEAVGNQPVSTVGELASALLAVIDSPEPAPASGAAPEDDVRGLVQVRINYGHANPAGLGGRDGRLRLTAADEAELRALARQLGLDPTRAGQPTPTQSAAPVTTNSSATTPTTASTVTASVMLPPPDDHYAAHLPGRVTVELAGVCDWTRDPDHWWRPDGTPLTGRPFINKTAGMAQDKEETYAFALRVTGRELKDFQGFGVGFENAQATPDTQHACDGRGNTLPGLVALFGNLPTDSVKHAGIRILLTEGPPLLKATWHAGDGERTIKYDGGAVTFKPPGDVQGEAVVPVVYPLTGWERHTFFCAYDRQGRKIDGQPGRSSIKHGMVTAYMKFPGLRAADVERVEYCIQPQTQLVLQNIARAEGTRTDFSILCTAPSGQQTLSQGGQHAPPVKPEPPAWRQRFDAVYALKEGENLRHIALPYIPERLQFYNETQATQAIAAPAGPDWMGLEWNGETVRITKMLFTCVPTTISLRDVLKDEVGLQRTEYEAPADLLALVMPGEWVVRKDAQTADLFKDLQKILAEQFHQPVRIEEKSVEREVFVARGNFVYHPLDGVMNPIILNVYTNQLDKEPHSGAGVGGVSEFLRAAGGALGVPVIDETEPNTQYGLNFRLHSDLFGRDAEDDPARADKVLAHIAAQTGLTFHKERRPVKIWSITQH